MSRIVNVSTYNSTYRQAVSYTSSTFMKSQIQHIRHQKHKTKQFSNQIYFFVCSTSAVQPSFHYKTKMSKNIKEEKTYLIQWRLIFPPSQLIHEEEIKIAKYTHEMRNLEQCWWHELIRVWVCNRLPRTAHIQQIYRKPRSTYYQYLNDALYCA